MVDANACAEPAAVGPDPRRRLAPAGQRRAQGRHQQFRWLHQRPVRAADARNGGLVGLAGRSDSLVPNWQVYQVAFDKPGNQRVTALWNGDNQAMWGRLPHAGAGAAQLLDKHGVAKPAVDVRCLGHSPGPRNRALRRRPGRLLLHRRRPGVAGRRRCRPVPRRSARRPSAARSRYLCCITYTPFQSEGGGSAMSSAQRCTYSALGPSLPRVSSAERNSSAAAENSRARYSAMPRPYGSSSGARHRRRLFRVARQTQQSYTDHRRGLPAHRHQVQEAHQVLRPGQRECRLRYTDPGAVLVVQRLKPSRQISPRHPPRYTRTVAACPCCRR